MKTSTVAQLAFAAALTIGAAGSPAFAADLSTKAPAYAPAVEPWSPWQIRVRALAVVPDSGNSTVNVAAVPNLSSPFSGLDMNNQVIPELDISYFFTPNIAAELILGVTRHHITGSGALGGLDIGKSWLLPPTLTLQYHFTNFGAFQPYVGVGVNYTVFFSQSATNAVTPVGNPAAGLAVTSLNIKNAPGLALQAGFDYMIDRHWGINFDVKKLFLRADYNAIVNNTIAVNGRANIDPWLIGGGVTYRF
ncbi:OmpW/AlkL family protein [Bradyrhizobium sp. 2TAF24]|uniref:OmpW/AlkL family protein n=1 Tax=Bradyrhizobium sp. 2TAF24 TaxID=3233011 RepID=UPI003F914859